MSIYEIVMLVCFGAAWPFSIYKSYKSKSVEGKSIIFLFIVYFGYVSGVLHKYFFRLDNVVFLYILNSFMVLADILLYYKNKRLQKHEILNRK